MLWTNVLRIVRNLLLNDFFIKDTHSEKALSNETPALTESVNMDIWVVGTFNQLLHWDS